MIIFFLTILVGFGIFLISFLSIYVVLMFLHDRFVEYSNMTFWFSPLNLCVNKG